MYRIEVLEERQITVVRISGVLTSSAVPDLLERLEDLGGDVELDLTELMHLGTRGSALLRTLQADGIELRGVSPYIRLQLDEGPD